MAGSASHDIWFKRPRSLTLRERDLVVRALRAELPPAPLTAALAHVDGLKVIGRCKCRRNGWGTWTIYFGGRRDGGVAYSVGTTGRTADEPVSVAVDLTQSGRIVGLDVVENRSGKPPVTVVVR